MPSIDQHPDEATPQATTWPGTRIMAVAIFLSISLVLLAGGSWYYRMVMGNLLDQQYQTLAAIGGLKSKQIQQWSQHMLHDAEQLTQRSLIQRAVADLRRQSEPTPPQPDLREKLQREVSDNDNLLLFAPDGTLLLATKDAPRLNLPTLPTTIAAALATNKAVITDFYVDAIEIAAAVRDAAGQPMAVMVWLKSPREYLYPLIQSWPIPNHSAETLLVQRRNNEAVFLNDLRYQPHSAFFLRFPLTRTEIPAVQAVLGKQGICEGRDYRGVAVLADLRPIPGTRWFIVTKIDREEILAEARFRTLAIWLVIGLFILLSAAAVAYSFRLNQARLFRDLYKAERQKLDAQETYHLLFDSMLDGFALHEIICDPAGKPLDYRFLSVNPAFEKLTGLRAAEVIGRTALDVMPETELRWIERYGHVALSGESVQFEEYSRALKRYFEVAAFCPAPGQFATVFIDVTARKHAELALLENATQLRATLESTADGILAVDKKGKILQANKRFVRLWRIPQPLIESNDDEALLQHVSGQLLDPDLFLAKVHALYASDAEDSDTLHFKDGRIVRRQSIAMNMNGAIIGRVWSFRDITKRKRAEEALKESEERFRGLFHGIHDAVFVYNGPVNGIPGLILEANDQACLMLGYTREELLCLQPADIDTPQTLAELPARIQLLYQHGHALWEGVYVHKNGRHIPVEINTHLFQFTGRETIISAVRDITRRKLAEQQLQLTIADLERSNNELEQFAYIASHDLQEPLRMVSSYTQLLARRYEDQLDDKAQKYIHYAVDGAVRMQTLINDLLAYSRVGSQRREPTPTDSHAALGQAIRNLTTTIQETQTVITNDDLPTVRADATQLTLVFQNLLGNAIKFRTADLPQIHVSARNCQSEWLFAVKDNGIGIDPQHAQRVFVIFQRLHTREEYAGTGIGLAVCQRIISRHGGKIWYESQPGHGTTFFFTLPK